MEKNSPQWDYPENFQIVSTFAENNFALDIT